MGIRDDVRSGRAQTTSREPARLLLSALLLLVACGPAPPPESSPAVPASSVGPRSVLLVTLDTTRPDRLSAYGAPRPTTPALAALAARGARFDAARAHAAETGPSLATVLTSRPAYETRVRGNAERLVEGMPTLAVAAKSAGLRTGAFVSTVLLRRDACGFDRAFDVYDDTMTDPCFGHARAQRIASRTVDAASAWLAAEAGTPFFAWVHLYDPHGPYEPPADAPDLSASRGGLAAPGGVPSIGIDLVPRYQRTGAASAAAVRDGRVDVADFLDRYDREIAYADRELGRLLRAVDPEATLVVVHADHGEALGEDGYWFRHGSLLHDAALRVPWIVAGPGVRAGTVVPDDVSLSDLAPTTTSLAGWPSLPRARGRDLSARLSGESSAVAVPPVPFVAEARKREIVADQTGIDCRWKLRVRASGRDVVVAGEDLVAGRDGLPGDLRALLVPWTEAPAADTHAEPPPSAGDLDEALRGLGYR